MKASFSIDIEVKFSKDEVREIEEAMKSSLLSIDDHFKSVMMKILVDDARIPFDGIKKVAVKIKK